MPLEGRMRRLRAARGMTQNELGLTAGVAPRSVCDYEQGRRGKVCPTHIQMSRLAAALGLDSADDLLYGCPKEVQGFLASGERALAVEACLEMFADTLAAGMEERAKLCLAALTNHLTPADILFAAVTATKSMADSPERKKLVAMCRRAIASTAGPDELSNHPELQEE